MNILHYTDDIRERILELWTAALPLDAITASQLENRVLLDENFDPETFLLAEESGRLEGFVLGMYGRRTALGEADPRGQRCWITALGIHPKADAMVVGSELLASVEHRMQTLGKKECWVSTYPPGYFTPGVDRRAYPLLFKLFSDCGYRESKEALSMDAPIALFELPAKTKEIERRLLSEGICVRTYQPGDLLRFLSFLESTMPTDWVRVERLNLKKMATGGFSADQITVVAKGGEIIGYCQFEGSHFGPFGVSEQYQGRGIGTVLLGRTLERMRMMGFHNAWVMWTDDVAAKVYAKFGFTQTRRFSILQKTFVE